MPAAKPLVVLLRGVNVGGHRTFKPSALARELADLDVANIGAAGNFVVRRPGTQASLRAELARRLPFDTAVMICTGRDILRLTAVRHFDDQPVRPDVVRFVSVLAKSPRSTRTLPVTLPASGKWLMKLLARDGRFVFGVYRRDMKAIGLLGKIDELLGVPATTRNWNTISAIAKVLQQGSR